jgi:C-terminal processing protease CtpA/Prc
VKKIFSLALVALFSITLGIQPFVFAQQKTQPSAGASAAGRAAAGSAATSRRATRTNSNAIPLIEKDFDEALRVIQENYVEGNKLDYNSVFKTSIIGMLRSLDPQSNYYDREQYEELKTDQRSE